MTAVTGWNAARPSAIEVDGEDAGGSPGQPPADGTGPAPGPPVEASCTIHSFVADHADDGRTDGCGNHPGIALHDSAYDGVRSTTGGGAVPDVRISDVTVGESDDGAGFPARGRGRGGATLTHVTLTGSAEGDVLIEPGVTFVIGRQAFTRRLLRPAGPHPTPGCGPATRTAPCQGVPRRGRHRLRATRTGDSARTRAGSRGVHGKTKSR